MAKQLEYQLLMEEQNVKLENLTKEIKDKIKMLKPTVGRYNSTPTNKLKDAITRQDVEISEMILDYIETDEYISNHGGGNDDDNEDDNNGGNNGDNNGGVDAKLEEEARIKKAEEDAITAANLKADADAKLEAKRLQDEEDAKKLAEASSKKPKYAFGTEDMEKAILEECNANGGFIKEEKLTSIIKRTANYPVQEVYSISLRKLFLKDIYKLQS